MSSFHNDSVVHNQAHLQNHYGHVFHGPIYNVPVHDVGDMNSDINRTSVLEGIKQSLAFPDMYARQCNVEEPHRDTCRWILEHNQYRQWAAQPSGLLWIKGKPGAGKSTLMAFLYRRLEETASDDDVQLDFFFSARGSALQKHPLGMIRALLHQLFSQDPSIRPPLRKAYQDKKDSFGADHDQILWQWQRPELEVLFLRLVQRTAKQRRVQIFVDALDEAGGQHACEVAAFFHKVNDATHRSDVVGLKICISCRHYPVPSAQPGSEVHVEKHNSGDIWRYIEDHFVFDQLTFNDVSDVRVWNDLRRHIEICAAGVFQWVVLVIGLIDIYVAEGHCSEDIKIQIQKVPDALTDLYEYIVRNVIQKESRPTSLLLFQWVCFAKRPLSIEEMKYALAANDLPLVYGRLKCHESPNFNRNNQRMISRLNSLSEGLVEVTKSVDKLSTRNAVQVIHQSVRDFLLAHGLNLMANLVTYDLNSEAEQLPAQEPNHFHIQGHNVLYQCCWNYLMIEGPSSVDMKKGQNMIFYQKDVRDDFPFLDYATLSLMEHAKASNGIPGPRGESYLRQLQSVLERWTFSLELWHSNEWLTPPFISERRVLQGATLLHVAVLASWFDLIRHLLASGVAVDAKDSRGRTSLHTAAVCGDVEAARVLLGSGANIEATTDNGQTPLSVAVSKEHWHFVELLLDRGADVECSVSSNRTPLAAAADDVGNAWIVSRMISAGANPNIKTKSGYTALLAASQHEMSDIVQILLKAGADPNMHCSSEPTPLVVAAKGNRIDTIAALLDAGATHDGRGLGVTALQEASSVHAYDTIMMPLSRGADINAPAGHLGGVLHAAIHRRLVSARQPVNVYRKEREKAKLILNQLLAAGADVNARGGEFETALTAASHQGRTDIMQLLIDSGANLNSGLSDSASPLLVAVASGQLEAAKYLLRAGADPLAIDSRGSSVLHVGAQVGRTEFLDILEHRELDLAAQDLLGRTPLHIALIWKRHPYALALIGRGARLDVLDVFGRSPLDYVYGSDKVPDGLKVLLRVYNPNAVDLNIDAVQQYLGVLVKTMKLKNRLPTAQRGLYDFIHCLAQLSDPRILLPWERAINLGVRSFAECALCARKVKHDLYICGQCPFFDLCHRCAEIHPPGTRPRSCCNHELFNVSRLYGTNSTQSAFDWFGIFRNEIELPYGNWWVEETVRPSVLEDIFRYHTGRR